MMIDTDDRGMLCPFLHLPKLEIIDLSHNKLSRLCESLGRAMPHTRTLKFAKNRFKDMTVSSIFAMVFGPA